MSQFVIENDFFPFLLTLTPDIDSEQLVGCLKGSIGRSEIVDCSVLSALRLLDIKENKGYKRNQEESKQYLTD